MTAQLCPACLANNVLAIANGPTCPHSEPHGVDWWPKDFASWPEPSRVAFIEQRYKLGERKAA